MWRKTSLRKAVSRSFWAFPTTPSGAQEKAALLQETAAWPAQYVSSRSKEKPVCLAAQNVRGPAGPSPELVPGFRVLRKTDRL